MALILVLVLAMGLSLAPGPEPGGVPRDAAEGSELTFNRRDLEWVSSSQSDSGIELDRASRAQGNVNNGVSQGNEPSSVAAAPEGTISYQGQLLQNGNPVNGSVLMTFTLYTVPSGGTQWWQEQQTVQVDDGLFNVMLGAVEPLQYKGVHFQNKPWLGVQPEGAAELTPRQPLGTVGYAFNVMPGATMVDADDGSAPYWTSFFVESANHPAIFGYSGVDAGVRGETVYTETAAVEGNSYGPAGTGVLGTTTGDGGHGVEGNNSGDSQSCPAGTTECASGVYGTASGDSYASMFYGQNRSASIMVQGNNSYYGLWVYNLTSPNGSGIWTNGASMIDDDLTVTGTKSGFVVDIALNDGAEPLEKGDVVVISGVDKPVLGNIPVVRVKKAATANSTAVMGVVDALYVPCLASEPLQEGQRCGGFDRSATTVKPGEYLSVVTLGAYEAIKVDATSGPIRAGDLLARSPSTGYTMSASPVTVQGVSFYAPGTVVGKALGELDEGRGTIPVFVSPR